MPYTNGSWRPLNNGEIEAAVVRVRSLVDGATPSPEDYTKNFQVEVETLLADNRGYTHHEVRRIGDHLLLDHFMNDALFRYYRAFHYAADITRPNGGLRYLEAPEWDQAMPMLLRALTYSSTEEQTIEAARLSFARIAAQTPRLLRLPRHCSPCPARLWRGLEPRECPSFENSLN